MGEQRLVAAQIEPAPRCVEQRHAESLAQQVAVPQLRMPKPEHRMRELDRNSHGLRDHLLIDPE